MNWWEEAPLAEDAAPQAPPAANASEWWSDAPVEGEAPTYNEAESAIAGAAQGYSYGLGDEGMAGLMTLPIKGGAMMLEGMGAEKKPDAPDYANMSLAEIYRAERDRIRNANRKASEDHPYWYAGGQVTGAVASPANKLLPMPAMKAGASGKTVMPTVVDLAKAGAASGGLYGYGASESDSLLGQAWDTAKGAGVGAVAAPVAGKAFEYAGKKLYPVTQNLKESANRAWFKSLLADETGALYLPTRDGKLTRAETLVYRTLVEQEGKTPQEAADLVRGIGKGPVPRTLPEMADSKTLLGYQKRLTQNPGPAGDVMEGFNKPRFETTIPDSFNQFVKENMSHRISPDLAGRKVSEAAKAVLQRAEDKRSALARPFYEKAFAQQIDDAAYAAVTKDPVVADAVKYVRGNSAYQREMADLPDNSIGVLDLAKRRIFDMAEAAKRGGNKNEHRLLMGAYDDLNTALQAQSPMYKAAVDAFKRNSPKVDRLNESILPVLKDLDAGQYRTAAQKVFSQSPARIRYTRRLIQSADPKAWDDLMASAFAEQADKATSATNLLTRFTKSSGVEAKWNAGLSKKVVEAKDRFFGDLKQAVKIKYGSDTATNQQIDEALEAGLGDTLLSQAASRKGAADRALEAVDWFRTKIRAKHYEDLARIFTGQGADEFAEKILRTKPGSPQSYNVIWDRIGSVSGSVPAAEAAATTQPARSAINPEDSQ